MYTLEYFNLHQNTKLETISFETEEDWDTLRTKGIGGSDVGAIMGINKHSSPLKVYKTKVEGFKEDLSENVNVKKGKALEDFILTNYVKPKMLAEGYEVDKPDFMMVNSDYPYFRANVDGIAFKKGGLFLDNIIIEIKLVSEWAEDNWNKKEYFGVPPSYYAQVQHYMLVTGASKAIICALFDGEWEMHYFEIKRDELFIKRMIAVCSKFYYLNMLAHIPPMINVEIDKTDTVAAVKKAHKPTVKDARMTLLAKSYKELSEKIKKAEAKKSQIASLILDGYTKGLCPDSDDYKVSLSVVKKNLFNQTKFKKDNASLYEQYCEENESSRLLVK